MTRLPQGAINSPAQFIQIVTKILQDLIPHDYDPFIDDVGVKGLMSQYDDKEVILGVY